MSKNTEIQTKQASHFGVVLSIAILVASFAVFYLNPLALDTNLYKVLILLAGVLVSALIFLNTQKGLKFRSFLMEMRIELRKVVWPTRDDTIKTTGIIIIAVIIVAIFLWIIDAFFTWAVQLLAN